VRSTTFDTNALTASGSTPARYRAAMRAVFSSALFDMRPWTRGDVEALHPILGDPRVVFWDTDAGPIEHTAEVLERIVTRSEEDRRVPGWLAVVERDTGQAVANVVLQTPTFDADGVEVGWHVRHGRWGEGIATEAASAAVERRELAEDAVVAVILPDNIRSQRVATKLGMILVDEIYYADRPHGLYRGQLDR
jgi:RimJ/RimL family protein N-acetyltransferase